jgi:uncharacterized membrane protein
MAVARLAVPRSPHARQYRYPFASIEITAQVPGQKIAWKSLDATENAGVITFEELAQDRTRITVIIDYKSEGILEKAG